MTHIIHIRTSNITEVDIPDDNDSKLGVEDIYKNKSDDDDMEALEEDVDGKNENNEEDTLRDHQRLSREIPQPQKSPITPKTTLSQRTHLQSWRSYWHRSLLDPQSS